MIDFNVIKTTRKDCSVRVEVTLNTYHVSWAHRADGRVQAIVERSPMGCVEVAEVPAGISSGGPYVDVDAIKDTVRASAVRAFKKWALQGVKIP